MKRAQAFRALSRRFDLRWGKGDHVHFYEGDRFVFGLAVATGSNGVDLPKHLAKRVKQLCKGDRP